MCLKLNQKILRWLTNLQCKYNINKSNLHCKLVNKHSKEISMTSITNSASTKSKKLLQNTQVSVKFKLAGLWTSVMFLYAYADIQHFVLQAGSIQEIMDGSLGGMALTPIMMFAAAVLMTYPSLMIFLSLALPAGLNRWFNIIFGTISTLTILGLMLSPGEVWAYYYFYNIVEIILTSLIVFFAIKWPRETS